MHKRLHLLLVTALLSGIFLLTAGRAVSAAPNFNDPGFGNTWNRVDKPVEERSAGLGRGYTWGPIISGTESIKSEAYGNGTRTVQYFDKARMEVNNPLASPADRYYVTTGLLVKELVTGLRQDGDSKFTPMLPSQEFVAGDPTNNSAPTYAAFRPVVTFAPGENAFPNLTGQTVGSYAGLPGRTTVLTFPEIRKNAFYDTVTRHNVPDVFMDYARTQGLIWDGSNFVNGAVYYDDDMLYVRGRPISEAYWTVATVGGLEKPVMVQLFERRVLTYTPSNPAGFQVEMGNVGQHYYRWRYQSNPKITPVWEVGYNPYRIIATNMATDGDGNTYLLGSRDSYGLVVNKYAPDNTLARQYTLTPCSGTSGTAYQIIYNAAVRQFYVSQNAGGRNVCIQTYDADFNLKKTSGGRDTSLVTVDNAGNLYFSSTAANVITKSNPEGEVLARFGVFGDTENQFGGIVSVIVDSQYNVYVVDYALGQPQSEMRYTIRKLDSTGKKLASWTLKSEATEAIVEHRVQAVINKSERLVLLNTYATKTSRVKSLYEYSPTGQLVASSKAEAGDGVALALGTSDTYKVLSVRDAAIYNYNASLENVGTWRYSANPGQFLEIYSIAVNTQGEVFVADDFNRQIQKFDANGKYLTTFGGNRTMQMATDRQGNLFVAESLFSDKNLVSSTQQIRKLDPSGKQLAVFGEFGRGPGQFTFVSSLATDGEGNVYVADYANQRISKFDNNGKYLQQWVVGASPGALAVDSRSNVYVYEQQNREIVRYDANGKLLGRWKRGGVNRTTSEDFTQRIILSTDAQDNVYVADAYSPTFERYTSDGVLTGSWRVPPTPATPPVGVPAMAVAPDGTLIAANQLNLDGRIIKYRLS